LVVLVLVDGEWGGVRGDKVRSICERGVRGVLGDDGVVGLILEEKVGDRSAGGGDRGDRRNEIAGLLLGFAVDDGDRPRVALVGVVGGVEPGDDAIELGLR
jgi:hypothetical protein